jgi:hypothetical protein
MKYKIHRIIVFGLIGFAMLILFSSTFQFEYLKKNRPKFPNIEKGEIYPKRMQQPFDVYLTQFDLYFLDLCGPIGLIMMMFTYYLNLKWKVIDANMRLKFKKPF